MLRNPDGLGGRQAGTERRRDRDARRGSREQPYQTPVDPTEAVGGSVLFAFGTAATSGPVCAFDDVTWTQSQGWDLSDPDEVRPPSTAVWEAMVEWCVFDADDAVEFAGATIHLYAGGPPYREDAGPSLWASRSLEVSGMGAVARIGGAWMGFLSPDAGLQSTALITNGPGPSDELGWRVWVIGQRLAGVNFG